MVSVLAFLICILASGIGAVVGAGVGVIIKPVMDMIGLMPVSTVSFCSGCTVLCMSCVSLLRNRRDGVQLRLKTSTALAVGTVLGGMLGKWLFEQVRSNFGNERVLGAVQAIFLTLITFAVFLYVCNKEKLPSKQTKSPIVAIVIGVCLGVISSFLRIGDGTSNVAVLFFFSMEAKEAAKNSLYIIIFSQVSSIVSSIVPHSVPTFTWPTLLCMIVGGVSGSLIGAEISKRIDNKDSKGHAPGYCPYGFLQCLTVYYFVSIQKKTQIVA